MGSGLSPNGLPFSQDGVVSMALLDKIKHLDLQRGRITVEAGARIQPVSLASHLMHSCLLWGRGHPDFLAPVLAFVSFIVCLGFALGES